MRRKVRSDRARASPRRNRCGPACLAAVVPLKGDYRSLEISGREESAASHARAHVRTDGTKAVSHECAACPCPGFGAPQPRPPTLANPLRGLGPFVHEEGRHTTSTCTATESDSGRFAVTRDDRGVHRIYEDTRSGTGIEVSSGCRPFARSARPTRWCCGMVSRPNSPRPPTRINGDVIKAAANHP